MKRTGPPALKDIRKDEGEYNATEKANKNRISMILFFRKIVKNIAGKDDDCQ